MLGMLGEKKMGPERLSQSSQAALPKVGWLLHHTPVSCTAGVGQVLVRAATGSGEASSSALTQPLPL